ncbi:MAG: DUF2878 domain-containing protein [Haliea sp.]
MKLAIIANLIIFNAVWFACVLGAANNKAWIGLLALLGFAVWQLSISRHRRADLSIFITAGVIGTIIDTAYSQTGLLAYASPAPGPDFAPWWIIALWLNFSLALNYCLRWLQGFLPLSVVFGFVGGPLAYYGGVKLDAVFIQTESVWPALLIIGLAWALVTPLLVYLSGWFVRQQQLTALKDPA